jgi:hypothetical protein
MNHRLRLLIMAATVFGLIGCTTWSASHAPLGSLDGKRVRLTTREGEQVEGLLMHPDTLSSKFLLHQHDTSWPLVVDTSSVASVDVRALHEGHTVGLVLLGAVAVVLTIIQIKLASLDPKF